MDKTGVEIIDHTGDTGLRGTAATLPELLSAMASALTRLICPHGEIRELVAREVEVTGGDAAALLVRWLGEVLYLSETHGELYGAAVISSLERPDAGSWRLRARLQGEPFDPARHRDLNEVKAVTYHLARADEGPDGWTGQVILDI
ncbi:archease [bacterium]|nr:archease [bacterium]MBU1072402.1 archease [bacterium]MBU1675502.1 archease [bacterium]